MAAPASLPHHFPPASFQPSSSAHPSSSDPARASLQFQAQSNAPQAPSPQSPPHPGAPSHFQPLLTEPPPRHGCLATLRHLFLRQWPLDVLGVIAVAVIAYITGQIKPREGYISNVSVTTLLPRQWTNGLPVTVLACLSTYLSIRQTGRQRQYSIPTDLSAPFCILLACSFLWVGAGAAYPLYPSTIPPLG